MFTESNDSRIVSDRSFSSSSKIRGDGANAATSKLSAISAKPNETIDHGDPDGNDRDQIEVKPKACDFMAFKVM